MRACAIVNTTFLVRNANSSQVPDLVCVLDLAQVGDQRIGVAADVHDRGEVLQQLHRLIVEARPVARNSTALQRSAACKSGIPAVLEGMTQRCCVLTV